MEELKRLLSDMADVDFGVSGKDAKQINEYFNRRALDALALLKKPMAAREQRYTYEDMLNACVRELKWRHRVYPDRVSWGKMKADAAKHQIGVMEAMIEHFKPLAENERAKADLFGGA
jgi:hypothetical protein